MGGRITFCEELSVHGPCMMQERSRRINAERYAVIREEYASTLADIDLALEEMVSSSAAAQRTAAKVI